MLLPYPVATTSNSEIMVIFQIILNALPLSQEKSSHRQKSSKESSYDDQYFTKVK